MARAVPDLIEEMAIAVLGADGRVEAVDRPPGGIAAYLRHPAGERDES